MSIHITLYRHPNKNFANLFLMPKITAKVILFCQIDTKGIVSYSLKIPIFARCLWNANVFDSKM